MYSTKTFISKEECDTTQTFIAKEECVAMEMIADLMMSIINEFKIIIIFKF